MPKVTKETKEYIYKGKKRYDWCYVCKKYISSNSLKRHILRKHIISVIKCSVCPKKFSCQSDLNNHKKVHDDVKQYGCLHCPEKFKWQSQRSLHIKEKHHEVERPSALLPIVWREEHFVHGMPSLRETSRIIYATDTPRAVAGELKGIKTKLI